VGQRRIGLGVLFGSLLMRTGMGWSQKYHIPRGMKDLLYDALAYGIAVVIAVEL